MKRTNQQGITTFWGISIVLMEAVIVLFVFYILYFFWIENPTPTENVLLVRAFRNRTVVIPTAVDTTGWLEYKNVTYNFSLLYPTGLKISEDEIRYGVNAGHVFSLTKEDVERFWLRIFPRPGDESISQAYERLTGIESSVYQSFTRNVGGVEAIAYRLKPGQTPQDHLYFVGSGYFFESPLDTFSAQILGTFEFIQ